MRASRCKADREALCPQRRGSFPVVDGDIVVISRMARVTEAAIHEALAGVADPGGAGSLSTLAKVSGLVVKDGNVGFALEVDPARGPQLEGLRKAAEAAVLAIAGVTSATAVLTAHRPGAGQHQALAAAQGHGHPHCRGAAAAAPSRVSVEGIRSQSLLMGRRPGAGEVEPFTQRGEIPLILRGGDGQGELKIDVIKFVARCGHRSGLNRSGNRPIPRLKHA